MRMAAAICRLRGPPDVPVPFSTPQSPMNPRTANWIFCHATADARIWVILPAGCGLAAWLTSVMMRPPSCHPGLPDKPLLYGSVPSGTTDSTHPLQIHGQDNAYQLWCVHAAQHQEHATGGRPSCYLSLDMRADP